MFEYSTDILTDALHNFFYKHVDIYEFNVSMQHVHISFRETTRWQTTLVYCSAHMLIIFWTLLFPTLMDMY